MKILNVVFARVWGGGEQYVYDMCCELNRRDIDNFILTNNESKEIYLKFSKITKVYREDLNIFYGILAINQILNLIDELKIDVINVHSGKMLPLFVLVKKFRKIKLVFFKHNSIASKKDLYHKYIRENLDAIVCVSRLVYNLQTLGLSLEEKKFFYLVYNGIYLDNFNKYSILKKNKNKFIIGYAGRIAYNKGIDILLNVVKKLNEKYNNIELKIVGQDDCCYLKEVIRFIEINNMSSYVKYIGFEKDMEKFYKSIDLFVLPSRAKESFGLVLCEAMYCGLPVITSNSGAQEEIITNEKSGFIIENIELELYDLIDKIYNGYYDINKITKYAHEVVEKNFDIKNTVEKLLRIYKY